MELGFPFSQNAILLIEGGAKLHGAKPEGKDDTDWYGLYVEPAEIAVGLDDFAHFVCTSGEKTGGNGREDGPDPPQTQEDFWRGRKRP